MFPKAHRGASVPRETHETTDSDFRIPGSQPVTGRPVPISGVSGAPFGHQFSEVGIYSAPAASERTAGSPSTSLGQATKHGDWLFPPGAGNAGSHSARSSALASALPAIQRSPEDDVCLPDRPDDLAPIAAALPPNINPFGPTELPPAEPFGPTQFPELPPGGSPNPLNPTFPKPPGLPNIPEPPPGGFPQAPPSPATPTPGTPPPGAAGGGGILDTLGAIMMGIGGTLVDFFPPVPRSILHPEQDTEA